MQELCCILKEEIVLLTSCGKVLKLQPFLLILLHSRVHPAAVTLCCMGSRIHDRYIHRQSLLLQQKSLARAWAISDFSLQLNAINNYSVVLWKTCVGHRSECPGAQSHCAAPEQVQHRTEAEVTGDGSKLESDKTFLSGFSPKDWVWSYSSITKWFTFQWSKGVGGNFYPECGMTPTCNLEQDETFVSWNSQSWVF